MGTQPSTAETGQTVVVETTWHAWPELTAGRSRRGRNAPSCRDLLVWLNAKVRPVRVPRCDADARKRGVTDTPSGHAATRADTPLTVGGDADARAAHTHAWLPTPLGPLDTSAQTAGGAHDGTHLVRD